jgi:hypothetical protein
MAHKRPAWPSALVEFEVGNVGNGLCIERRFPSSTKRFWQPISPVGGMIRVVLVDEDNGSIGEANLGFSESADRYESLYIPVIH